MRYSCHFLSESSISHWFMVKHITNKKLPNKNTRADNLRKYSKWKESHWSFTIAIVTAGYASSGEHTQILLLYLRWCRCMVLAELCTGGIEASGRKTHFTPEQIFANWNWCFLLSENSAPEGFIFFQKISLNDSTSWFWVQFPTEVLRLYFHLVIYFLNFICSTFSTVLKSIPWNIYVCI